MVVDQAEHASPSAENMHALGCAGCDLTQLGSTFEQFDYAIAFARNASTVINIDQFDLKILALQASRSCTAGWFTVQLTTCWLYCRLVA